MAKRNRKIARKNNKTKIKVFFILFLIIAVVGGTYAGINYLPTFNDTAAKENATSVLDRIKLDPNYLMTRQAIYGNKKMLPWDTGDIPASSREYIRTANVDLTVAEVKAILSKTDLTFIDEPTPTQNTTKINYKSKDNKYFQIVIASKANYDELLKTSRLGITQLGTNSSTDPNDGPTVVKIMANPYQNKF